MSWRCLKEEEGITAHSPVQSRSYRSLAPLRFHAVYRGADTTHRISRLQPSSQYTLRIAASSGSGQGEWSDEVTFTTTPASPPIPSGEFFLSLLPQLTSCEVPADLQLCQTGSKLMVTWTRVDFDLPLTYDAQIRQSSSRDYQQVVW